MGEGGRRHGCCRQTRMPVACSRRPSVPKIAPSPRAIAGARADVSGSRMAAVRPDAADVKYLVLAERAVPYLLARVRWPDIAQAITVGSPDWLNDMGLFDLPYDLSAVPVSYTQAASVAAGWGGQLRADPAHGAQSFIRRMPANWSNLSPVERRAYGIESVGRRRPSSRHVRRLRASQAKNAASAASPADGPGNAAAERRRQARVGVAGQVHIRSGHTTISAGLVDLSEGGVQCVLPETRPPLAADVLLDGPFLLEAEVIAPRICLDVAGRISWHRSTIADTRFGVFFGRLDDGEIEGVQRFIAAACSRRGSR